MSSPTKAELRQARDYSALLPHLATLDVVWAVTPDGKELLIKGRDLLDSIIATKRERPVKSAHVAALTKEVAAALEGCLGKDGCFNAPGATGHA